MASFPNQRTVTIHKPLYEGNFVQVDIDDWQEAFALLTKSSFGLYLYCCGNKDGYNLELTILKLNPVPQFFLYFSGEKHGPCCSALRLFRRKINRPSHKINLLHLYG